MSFDAQAKNSVFYVHKLRLEASEGARVEVRAPIERADESQESATWLRTGGWIVAKLVGAAVAAAAVLGIVASQ